MLMRVNVGGTEAAVRAAARAGVPRVVLTSSAATVGEPAGTVGHEDTTHRGSYLHHTPGAETFHRTIEWAVTEGLVTRPLPRRE
jgi:nucleoside-diphosphate-sugar epimerase